ncbi:hypothetical protein BBK36DRAFT_1190822, partial [Trichoderma citrinoviride]
PVAHLYAPHHANFRAFDLTCHPDVSLPSPPCCRYKPRPPALPKTSSSRSARFSLNPTNEQIPNPESPTTYRGGTLRLGKRGNLLPCPPESQKQAASRTFNIKTSSEAPPLLDPEARFQTAVFYRHTHVITYPSILLLPSEDSIVLLFLSSPALHPGGLDSVTRSSTSQLHCRLISPLPLLFDTTCCAE